MSPEPSRDRWYALQVRTRWESSTSSLLSGKGYQAFFPTYTTEERWRSGMSKGTSAPLFPGYVFCQFDPLMRLPILVTLVVISVVLLCCIPVPVEVSVFEE